MKATSPRNPELTRQQLLEAAFEEIHEYGFQAASLERILSKTHLTKGALYHHFENKHALGLAVVDEVIALRIEERRITPMCKTTDPITTFFESVKAEIGQLCPGDYERGCPLNNLVQEMSSLDEAFRQHLLAIVDRWRQTLAAAFKRGQMAGRVRTDVNENNLAMFIIAAYMGTIGLNKLMDHDMVHGQVLAQTAFFLNTLKP